MKQILLLLLLGVSQLAFSSRYPFQFRSNGEKNAFMKIEGGNASDYFRCALYAGELKQEHQFDKAVVEFDGFLKEIEAKLKGKRGSKEVKLIQKMILKKYGKYQSDNSAFADMALNSISSEHSLSFATALVLSHFQIPFLFEETRADTRIIALEGMDQVIIDYYPNTSKSGPNEEFSAKFLQIFRDGGFIKGAKDWPFDQDEFKTAYYTKGDDNLKEALSSVFNMHFWNELVKEKTGEGQLAVIRKAYFLNASLRNRYALLLLLEDEVSQHGVKTNEDKMEVIELANLYPSKSPNAVCVVALSSIFDDDSVKKDSLLALKNWISLVKHDSTRYEMEREFYLQLCYYFNNTEQHEEAIASAKEFLKYRKPSRQEQGILGIIVGNNLGELNEKTPFERMNDLLAISEAVDETEFPKQKRYRQIIHMMLLGILLETPDADEAQIKRSFDYVKDDLSIFIESGGIDDEGEFWAELVEELSMKKKCALAKEILKEAKEKFPNHPLIKREAALIGSRCK